MAGTVDKVAAGFLDPRTGNIRSQKELKAIDSRLAASKDGETKVVSESTNPLGAVRSRVTEQANSIISDNNKQIDVVNEAQKLTKQQIDTAKELKSLIKDGGSSDAIEAKRNELSELREKSEKLKSKVDQQNKDIEPERIRSIRLGNETKGTYTVKKVEYQAAGSTDDLDEAKEVQAYIDQLQIQSQSLRDQKTEFKETKKEVKAALNEARGELKELDDHVLTGFDQAKGLASRISDAVTQAGLKAVEAHSLNEVSARVLLG